MRKCWVTSRFQYFSCIFSIFRSLLVFLKNVHRNAENTGKIWKPGWSPNIFLMNFDHDPPPPLPWLWARGHHGHQGHWGRLPFRRHCRVPVPSLAPWSPQNRTLFGTLFGHLFGPQNDSKMAPTFGGIGLLKFIPASETLPDIVFCQATAQR